MELNEDDDIARAIALSLEEATQKRDIIDIEDDPEVDDEEARFQAQLQRALAASQAESTRIDETPRNRQIVTEVQSQPPQPQHQPVSNEAGTSSFLSQRAQLEKERRERQKRLRPDTSFGHNSHGDDDDEDEGLKQPPAKRQHISSSYGERPGNNSASSSSQRGEAVQSAQASVSTIDQLFWDGELRPTATQHSEPRKDGRPSFRLTDILGRTTWLQDIPLRGKPIKHDPKAPQDFPTVLQGMLHSVHVHPALKTMIQDNHPDLPIKSIEELRMRWDWSKVKVYLVPSIAGKHEGWPNVVKTGHPRLMHVVRNMGLRTGKGKGSKVIGLECQMIIATHMDVSKGKQEPGSDTEDDTDDDVEVIEPAVGWAYIGSHNFTPSAWGTLSGSAFNPILSITNYELGIIFPLVDKEQADLVACFQRPPVKYGVGDVPWMQEESEYHQNQ
ncbi:hypothetical protein DXG01_014116 [Tephrocybe rancida]|nr:hypothetical protein DXG01_014116 [Tephrocybe rancida]